MISQFRASAKKLATWRRSTTTEEQLIISYIIIAYNAEKTLLRAIRSVLTGNGRARFELIIVDDCSTDRTCEVAKKAASKDNRLRLISRPQNGGRAAARNSGLDAAQGRYIFFLDADDFLMSHNIGEIEPLLSAGADMVVPGRLDFNLESGDLYSFSHTCSTFQGLHNINGSTAYPGIFLDNFITGKFFSKVNIDKYNIRCDEERRNAEDILFSSILWMNYREISFSSIKIYCYGRGKYRSGFNSDKCVDALVNFGRLLDLDTSAAREGAEEALVNKYAIGLFETVRRGEGVIDRDVTQNHLAEHFRPIDLDRYHRLRFTNDRVRNFMRACNSGNFELALKTAVAA